MNAQKLGLKAGLIATTVGLLLAGYAMAALLATA